MPVYEPVEPKVDIDWKEDAVYAAWKNLPRTILYRDEMVQCIKTALNAAIEAQLNISNKMTPEELWEALDVNKDRH